MVVVCGGVELTFPCGSGGEVQRGMGVRCVCGSSVLMANPGPKCTIAEQTHIPIEEHGDKLAGGRE